MADMMFDNREDCLVQINLLLNKADVVELNKFLRILVKHFWPKCI